MKKRIAILFFAVVIAVSALTLTGCGSMIDKYKKVISDWRNVALFGSSNSFTVDIISGWREENFSLDGVSGSKIDYTVFTVTPKSETSSVDIDITVGNKEYKTPCDKHPLGSTFSAEIPVRLDLIDTIDLYINGESVTASTQVSNLTITGENALEIASAQIPLDKATEIYVRLIENPVTAGGNFYWYVAAYCEDGTKAVIIDIVSGEILAARK